MKLHSLILFLLFTSLVFFACAKKKDTNKQEIIEEQAETPNKENSKIKGLTLSADIKVNTYDLINHAFAGNGDVLETPDCAHPAAAPHITQVYDDFLKTYVFAFKIHVTPDNDRCNGKTDRQRNEIKTYGSSPDTLKASLNETVAYSWMFKLDKDFQPSPNFTHLHQIKPIDGDDDLPIITFTGRYKASGNKLEVIHTGGTGKETSQGYLASIPLSDFLGEWVQVTEQLTFANDGKYQVKITRVSDQKVLLDLIKEHIDTWRDGTTFCRPKWGIYRSLLSSNYLRDETVYFNNFNITEIK